MLDSYGRNIDYIRISITDRCNLRCVYCMPKDGVALVDCHDIMTFDEIERLSKIFAKNGIKKIKVTGGEPLVRLDAVNLIKNLKEIESIEQVTLTTNGVLLEETIDELHKAGIDGINVSLDILDRDKFAQITRRDVLNKVWAGIKKTLTYEDINLKINCVPLKLTKDEITGLVGLAKDHKIHVRFIEMMPIGLGHNFECLPEEDTKKLIEEVYGPLEPYAKKLGNGPSHYYSLQGFKGKIGFISAISHKFCNECNRIRLTSMGFLKTCLQYNKGVDLLELMRKGANDFELEEAISKAINAKPLEHSFLSKEIDQEEVRGMSQIGG